MKKKLSRIITVMLSAVMVLSAVSITGCSKKKNAGLKEEDVYIWGCSANEKIMQEVSVDSYADKKTDAILDIFMAKGEYESDQIIITPAKDVEYYNVTVSELKLADGSATIPSDNIQIRKAKYVKVAINWEKNGAPLGMYPDALLPWSAAVEYEENNIKANENQSIYLTIETPIDQKVGVYTGQMKIDFDVFSCFVPITIAVMDVTVSEEVHTKSCYLANWSSQHGELDTTQGMRDAYIDALIEYRLAPSRILYENDHSAEMIEIYAEKAYELLQNPRCSNVGLPNATKSYEYERDGKRTSYNCMDMGILRKYLVAFMDKSIETQFNLIKKTTIYNAVIDEAFYMGRPYDQVRLNYSLYNTLIKELVKEYEAKDFGTPEFKQELIQSLKTLPCILTCEYNQEYIKDCKEDEYPNCYCPMYQWYDDEAARDQYDNDEHIVEEWWYGCNFPQYPYPSTHVDITDTIPLRVMGWMQAEYGIVGNLNWAVDNYKTGKPEEKRDTFAEEYYDVASDYSSGTYVEGNGEGYMFFPGGQYGLDKPVATLRIEAIRDGLEEYEVIYALKEKYAQLGLSADDFLESLGTLMHSGARVTANTATYEQLRWNLYNLAQCNNSSASMCIIENKDNNNGTITSKVYVNNGIELKNNGTVVTEGVDYKDGKIYSITTDLDDDNNSINLSYTIDGIEYTYGQSFGGKALYFGADKLVNSFKKDSAIVSSSLVDVDGVQAVKLDVGEVNDTTQRIVFEDSSMSDIGENTLKLTLSIKNEGAVDIDVVVSAKYTKAAAIEQLVSQKIAAGEEKVVTIDVSSINWAIKGNISYLRLKFNDTKPESDTETEGTETEGTETEGAKTLLVKSFMIYYK